MTAVSRTITISLSPALQARMRERATLKGITRSEYVRSLIEHDLDGEALAEGFESQLGFIELGIDALLKHHPNEGLRDVVHNTHRGRLSRRGGGSVQP